MIVNSIVVDNANWSKYSLEASQEIIRRLLDDLLLTSSRVRVKLDIFLLQVLVQLHNGSLIITAVAVVGCTEDCTYLIVVLELIAFVHHLMCTCHHTQTVWMHELLCYVLCIAHLTAPKTKPAPRGLLFHPFVSSGSLQSRSEPAPL